MQCLLSSDVNLAERLRYSLHRVKRHKSDRKVVVFAEKSLSDVNLAKRVNQYKSGRKAAVFAENCPSDVYPAIRLRCSLDRVKRHKSGQKLLGERWKLLLLDGSRLALSEVAFHQLSSWQIRVKCEENATPQTPNFDRMLNSSLTHIKNGSRQIHYTTEHLQSGEEVGAEKQRAHSITITRGVDSCRGEVHYSLPSTTSNSGYGGNDNGIHHREYEDKIRHDNIESQHAWLAEVIAAPGTRPPWIQPRTLIQKAILNIEAKF
ncbi:hypothetical protein RND71_034595 [Anisodus tanguticus]|uniref:Uncharacterized protein n=1 Tax=Anisodus tanguticus TaxID=243964 RepID=A0AAE1RAH8_9SOLA|nr:hypothetical protein RND71_034595 [Anisodus tanguticus]